MHAIHEGMMKISKILHTYTLLLHGINGRLHVINLSNGGSIWPFHRDSGFSLYVKL